MYQTFPINHLIPGAILRVFLHKEHTEHRLVGEFIQRRDNDLEIVPIAEWRHDLPVPLMRQFGLISLKAPGMAKQHDEFRLANHLPGRIQVLQLPSGHVAPLNHRSASWRQMMLRTQMLADQNAGTWVNLGTPMTAQRD